MCGKVAEGIRLQCRKQNGFAGPTIKKRETDFHFLRRTYRLEGVICILVAIKTS